MKVKYFNLPILQIFLIFFAIWLMPFGVQSQTELAIRVINSSGEPVTGLTDANIKFRISPYGPGEVVSGITVTETGTQGNYICMGFTTFQLVKLYINDIEQTWFGRQYSGDPAGTFVDQSTNETIAGIKSFTGIVLLHGGQTVITYPYQDESAPFWNGGEGPPPYGNSLVWKYWVENNFVSGTAFLDSCFIIRENRILVDSKLSSDITGTAYNDIQSAIDYCYTSGSPSTTNRWEILILPHQNAISGYSESLNLRDFIDLTGTGMVKLTGTISRSGTMADKDCKIENLYFEITDANVLVKKLRAINCIFFAIEDNTATDITIENSQCNNSGFYITGSGTVNVSGANRIVNCFGNKNIGWGSGDDVMNYAYNTSGSYQF